MRIVLINESFHSHLFYRRWELFAETYPDVDVTLLTPAKSSIYKSKNNTFGSAIINEGHEVEKKNFHIKLIQIHEFKYLTYFGYYSNDFRRVLKELNPDFVYNIGTHHQFSLYQIIKTVKKNLPGCKVAAFSMRGPDHNLDNLLANDNFSFKTRLVRWLTYMLAKPLLHYVNRHCDAIFCHYPDAVSSFRKEGYEGPIYMQTQVGLNTERYYPDNESRKKVRDKYNLGDSYVFGSATRFTADKGLEDIINALPLEGNWKYLMMGSGRTDEVERIKTRIKERGLEDKIILTGLISRNDMPAYFNALDCAIHCPRTTRDWVETFSIALVQEMATSIPVVANDSGSVPYQVGPDGIIVKEGNLQQMTEKFNWLLSHREEGKAIGALMRERAVNSFGIVHLNELFYDTIHDILEGQYDELKSNQATYKTRYEE